MILRTRRWATYKVTRIAQALVAASAVRQPLFIQVVRCFGYVEDKKYERESLDSAVLDPVTAAKSKDD